METPNNGKKVNDIDNESTIFLFECVYMSVTLYGYPTPIAASEKRNTFGVVFTFKSVANVDFSKLRIGMGFLHV